MLTRHSKIYFCSLTGLLFLTGLPVRHLAAPTPSRAQADYVIASQNPAPGVSIPAAPGTAAAAELFRQHCSKCHGADGTGKRARARLPEIPNFTEADWQARHTDADLRASVLDGKGTAMPAQRSEISEDQVGGLVAYIRTFARTGEKRGEREKDGSALASFDKNFNRLEQEMNNLRRQYHDLPKAAAGGEHPRSSELGQHSVARQSALAAPEPPKVAELFRQRRVKCHGADGKGKKRRERLPEIPDFTNSSWQARRADSKLLASILDGKGDDMPPQRGKISEEQARGLVTYVRGFAPTKGNSNSKQGKQGGPTEAEPEKLELPRDPFDKWQPSAPPPDREQAESSKHARSPVAAQSASRAAGIPDVGELFRRLCVECHGADGTGNKARGRLPEIPNFTDAEWQGRRADPQLMASILDGKGDEMPAERGKVSEEQARGLVTYVRTFAVTTGKQGPAAQEGATLAESEEIEPARGFLQKLIRWLGKFHPPAVHFPIALLTAAAVAELLRLTTGNPAFDGITRFCLWFGTFAGAGGGALGWFLAGFRLTDASCVLMTHRWLGTSTVACSGLVLVLSEASRRPDRRTTRICFRVTLFAVAALVSVTGFFGGAVVYGLNHYSWPR